MPKAPPRKNTADSTTTTSSGSPAKKSKFYDHDPYRLPDVDLEAAIAQATRSAMPDPRLATEEEMRTFIEETSSQVATNVSCAPGENASEFTNSDGLFKSTDTEPPTKERLDSAVVDYYR